MSRFVASAIILIFAGCDDPGMDRMRAIKLEVCACKSSTCADSALKRVAEHDVPSNHRTQQLARAMLACLAKKLHEEDRPTTDPDRGEPTATGPGSGAATRTP